MKTRRLFEPVGIIDIGSNSVRLCVYDATSRVPIPLFNEKSVCALAEKLNSTGRLNPQGIELAMVAIGRFVGLARAMAVKNLDVLATAAVRDATDGPDFVGRVERRFGINVQVLSGGEEARLAAMGVLCGSPEADGIVCDLGGGSLELITVRGGEVGEHVTMPLGLLRLAEASGDNRAAAAEIIDRAIADIPWLWAGRNRNIYAVGGAWRALARICISQTHHPLSVLDNFGIDIKDAWRIVDLVSSQSRKSLEKIPGMPKKRLSSLPLAALVLERVIRKVLPRRLVFSSYGMREGQFFQRMPEPIKAEDPLLSVCHELGQSSSRFAEHGEELMKWMAPLFPNETPHQARIRLAACMVSDAFWNEHPDTRAEQAFLRILRLPFMGVSHACRAAIALTVFLRYQGDEEDPAVRRATSLLDADELRLARLAGGALRLAHTLSAGVPSLLRMTRLEIVGKDLVLVVPADNPAFVLEDSRAFDRLAKLVDCDTFALKAA